MTNEKIKWSIYTQSMPVMVTMTCTYLSTIVPVKSKGAEWSSDLGQGSVLSPIKKKEEAAFTERDLVANIKSRGNREYREHRVGAHNLKAFITL